MGWARHYDGDNVVVGRHGIEYPLRYTTEFENLLILFDHKFFNDEITAHLTAREEDDYVKNYGHGTSGIYLHRSNEIVIKLFPGHKSATDERLRSTLLHEMCHSTIKCKFMDVFLQGTEFLKIQSCKDNPEGVDINNIRGHHEIWQQEMMRLYYLGAPIDLDEIKYYKRHHKSIKDYLNKRGLSWDTLLEVVVKGGVFTEERSVDPK